jgi:ribosome-associated protein
MPLDDDRLTVGSRISIPLAEFEFRASRSSGPGGQNVNKVNSRVQMWWDVTRSLSIPEDVRQRFLRQQANRITKEGRLLLDCQQHRTQLANRAGVLSELEKLLHRALVVPKKRRKTKASRGSHERRLQGKRERSEKKAGRRFRHD